MGVLQLKYICLSFYSPSYHLLMTIYQFLFYYYYYYYSYYYCYYYCCYYYHYYYYYYYYKVSCLLAGSRTYGRYLCSIDKLSSLSFSIFSFLFQFPISSPVSQIIQESYSSSSYSFHFRHLSFNGIIKEAISSQNMTDLIDFSTQDFIQKCFLLSYTVKNLLISYFL